MTVHIAGKTANKLEELLLADEMPVKTLLAVKMMLWFGMGVGDRDDHPPNRGEPTERVANNDANSTLNHPGH
eukprot:739975-Amphidinium_carterae.1